MGFLSSWKRRVGTDVDDELSFHIEMKTRELVEQGLSPSEAAEAARRLFGDVSNIRQDCVGVQREIARRTVRRELLASFRRDVRHALRSLRRAPGFTAVLVVTLALGISATAATFSMLDTLLLKPLPYPEQGDLAVVWERRSEQGVDRDFFSLEEYDRLVASTGVFEETAAFTTRGMTVTGGGVGPERIGMVTTTSSLFPMLGARPLYGRLLVDADDVPGDPIVVVLSYELWQRRYGGDPSAVGEMIRLNGTDYTIVGVLSADLNASLLRSWADAADVFIPVGSRNRGSGINTVLVRKGHAVSWRGVQAELDRFAANEPQARGNDIRVEVFATPLVAEIAGDLGWGLIALFGSAGILLLIASANVATLLLSRAPLREREMAVYAALGASRRQLVRRALVESTILALGAGVVAIAVVLLVQQSLQALPPAVEWSDRGLTGWRSVPWLRNVGVDMRVLGFTGGVMVLTTLLFGLWPALHASGVDPGAILGRARRTVPSYATRRVRITGQDAIVVIQVALTFVLLVGGGLVVRSFINAQRTDLGFEARDVLSMYVNPAGSWNGVDYRTRAGAILFYESVLDGVRAIPGVQAAAFIDGLPQAGSVGWTRLYPVDRPEPAGGAWPVTQTKHVTSGYLDAMGITLLEGRWFDERDRRDTDPVIVVDDRLAALFWPDGSAVGKRIRGQCAACDARTVIGVVGAVRHRALEVEFRQAAYDPVTQNGDGGHGMYLVVKANDPSSLADEIVDAIHTVDPNQPVIDVQTMQARLADTLLPRRLSAITLQAFALLALLLTVIGLYGTIMHGVTLALHGIAVRLALGAQRMDVRTLVLRRAASLTSVGLLIGLLGALLSTRLLRGLLYGVAPTDASVIGLFCAVMATVGLLAAWIPARRAMAVDPIALLKSN